MIKKRETKKNYLKVDKICAKCGAIINSYYLSDCILCEGPLPVEDDGSHVRCEHKEFIDGNTSKNIRTFLDFHIEDLRALSDIHGCHMGSRVKMVVEILKKLNPSLDKRVDEDLIKRVILRNRKKFWYLKDIELLIKKKKEIKIIEKDEIIEMEYHKE